MKDSIVADNIMIPDFPIEANYGQWAMEHPECDSVAEQIEPWGQTPLRNC